MHETTKKTTRRQFLETATACAAGTAMATMCGRYAAAETTGRAHYKVFQPLTIGKMELKNRLFRSAAFMNVGQFDNESQTALGFVTDDAINTFRTFAENEVSMVQTGYLSVMDYGRKRRHLSASSDKFIPGLAKLADAVHKAGGPGCAMVAEIGHDGTSGDGPGEFRASKLNPTGGEWPNRISPSGITSRGRQEEHELTTAEVDRFCSDMGDAARRLKEAGWDGCNLHGAHGYLINTFVSPASNRRTDKYGGSMYKRLEIVRESVRQIHDKAGSDFPVLIKVSCDDSRFAADIEGAVTMDTFPAYAKMVEECGIDAIDVSGPNPIRSDIDAPEDQSYYKEYVAKLKDMKIPVGLSGGNRNVELLEALVAKPEGAPDFFCFARPLIRQPGLIKQWREGTESKSACTNISLCFRQMYSNPPQPAYCVQLERERLEREKSGQEARAFIGEYERTFGA